MDEIEAEQIINSAVHFLVEAGWDSYPSDHPLRNAIATLLSQAREEGAEKYRREGWRAGFMASGEGWNGEYPLEYQRKDDVEALQTQCDEWIESLKEKK